MFAGAGTFSFCNYWAKIFSTLLFELGEINHLDYDENSVILLLTEKNIGINILRLVVHYSYAGTLSGFGKLEQDSKLMTGRALLVNAMEVFIIAHEVYHFKLEEDYPEQNGVPPDSTVKEMELLCDSMSLAISTVYGKKNNNPFSFQFLAPLIFFHSLKICENGREYLLDEQKLKGDSHPTPQERIEWIYEFAKQAKVPSQVLESMQYITSMAITIEAYTESRLQLLNKE